MKEKEYLNLTIYEILERNDLLDMQGLHLETNLRRNCITKVSDVIVLSSYKILKISRITEESLSILRTALKSVDLCLYGESPDDIKIEELFKKLGTKNKTIGNKVLKILYEQDIVTVDDLIEIPENILISVYGINKSGIKYLNNALSLIDKKLKATY